MVNTKIKVEKTSIAIPAVPGKSAKTTPMILVVDWWDMQGIRHYAGEVVKVTSAIASLIQEQGVATPQSLAGSKAVEAK